MQACLVWLNAFEALMPRLYGPSRHIDDPVRREHWQASA
jgi:hypothetical protein